MTTILITKEIKNIVRISYHEKGGKERLQEYVRNQYNVKRIQAKTVCVCMCVCIV